VVTPSLAELRGVGHGQGDELTQVGTGGAVGGGGHPVDVDVDAVGDRLEGQLLAAFRGELLAQPSAISAQLRTLMVAHVGHRSLHDHTGVWHL